MVRHPDLKTVAAKIRGIVGAHQGAAVGHQKSLNLAAELFGFKNWAHYEQTGNASAAPTTAQATSPAAAQNDLADPVYDALQWVSNNYQTTLAGKPVRDADECLVNAKQLLERRRKQADTRRFVLAKAFPFITETSPTIELGEGPGWVELTIDQAFVDTLFKLSALCTGQELTQVATAWSADNWEPEEKNSFSGASRYRGGDFNMRGDTLVVTPDHWRFRAYPKHCDYDVQTRSLDIAAFLKAIEAKQAGTPESTWTAYKWVGDVLLYSGSGEVSGLQAELVEQAVLPQPDEDAQAG